MDTPSLSAIDLRLALKRRYPAESHAIVFEVSADNGGGGRRADAVAVALWSSLGHEVHGFEIKVSRQDLLKELKQPEKHVQVSRYCHRWWLVTPAGLVKPGELPEYWGLLELSAQDRDLKSKTNAPLLTPAAIDHAFLGSLMRARSRLDDAEIAESINRTLAMNDALRRQAFDERVKTAASIATRDAERVLDNARKVQERTGVDLLGWHPSTDEFAQTLKYAMQGQLPELMTRVRRIADNLQELSEAIHAQVPEDATQQVIRETVIPRLARRRS